MSKYTILCECLRSTLSIGSMVYGGFVDGKLKGFAAVENTFFGSQKQYLELSFIHVSADCRGHGIGRMLMDCAKK